MTLSPDAIDRVARLREAASALLHCADLIERLDVPEMWRAEIEVRAAAVMLQQLTLAAITDKALAGL